MCKNIRHLHIKQSRMQLYNRIYLAETRLVASVDGRAGYIPSMYLPASRADGIVLADVRGKRVRACRSVRKKAAYRSLHEEESNFRRSPGWRGVVGRLLAGMGTGQRRTAGGRTTGRRAARSTDRDDDTRHAGSFGGQPKPDEFRLGTARPGLFDRRHHGSGIMAEQSFSRRPTLARQFEQRPVLLSED